MSDRLRKGSSKRLSKDDYQRALDAAVREYETLVAERGELDARISQLQHSIAALTRLCGFEPTVPLGLTEACRLVLRNSPVPLTALELRDRLTSIGVDVTRYSNALASIHTVIRRMQESGEVLERDREEDERKVYVSVLPSLKRRPPGQGLTPPKDRKK
jgi:hypothetical protein